MSKNKVQGPLLIYPIFHDLAGRGDNLPIEILNNERDEERRSPNDDFLSGSSIDHLKLIPDGTGVAKLNSGELPISGPTNSTKE